MGADVNGFDLTAYMRTNGILRISDSSPRQDGSSFAVRLTGDILGTGLTVGDALNSALQTRAARNTERKAA